MKNIEMQDAEKRIFKSKLKLICKSLIENRISSTRLAIQRAQEAANSEEKSSVGDKYETSRAMSHLEKDMHSRQLAEILHELAAVQNINVDKICSVIEPGAFVECSGASFFIVGGMGKQIVDAKEIYFLSPNAPLAKILYNKKRGQDFLFNQVQIRIVDIY